MTKKALLLVALGLAFISLCVWGLNGVSEREAAGPTSEAQVPNAAHSAADSGDTSLNLDTEAVERAGITIAPVQRVRRHEEADALAVVLAAHELVELRTAYMAARSQAERANLAAQTSLKEFERIQALHRQDFNVSTRTKEAAQAQWQSDEAAGRAADAALEAIEQAAVLKWGRVLSRSVFDHAPSYQRLMQGSDVLLRVSTPAGVGLTVVPAVISIHGTASGNSPATLVAPSPLADPRIQTPTYFYIAPAAGLLPGTTVSASFPVGAALDGGIIPADAVVWWRGLAWYYEQTDAGHFVRRDMGRATPQDSGWFVAGLTKQQVVVRGAQTLLSQELRSQIEVGEEGR